MTTELLYLLAACLLFITLAYLIELGRHAETRRALQQALALEHEERRRRVLAERELGFTLRPGVPFGVGLRRP